VSEPTIRWPEPQAAARSAEPADLDEPEEVLSPRHARTGDRYYPRRAGPLGDPRAETARREALWARGQDPWVVGAGRPIGQLSNMADEDPAMRRMAAHPRIVAVLRAILAPDAKLWFDHVFSKPPLNAFDHSGYAKGSNRYHQDGFFQFSREGHAFTSSPALYTAGT
jgi:hypothetical protein